MFLSNPLLSNFPYKCIMNQSWPLCKKVKDQSRVIIWTYLVVLECPMLNTKFQWSQLFSSEEEDFYWFLPYMGMVAILVMWPKTVYK